MILFLEYLAEGKRGGEVYASRFHSFIVSNFPNVIPGKMQKKIPELKNIFKHAMYNYRRVIKNRPDLIVIDISSGLRNILAVYKNRKQKGKLLLLIQEQRITYRINLFFIKWIVRAAEKYYVRKADIILANSQYSVNIALKKGLGNNTQVVIANPGLQLALHGNNPNYNEEICEDEPLNLLFVGECVERKGVIYIIEALGQLKDLNIKLHIAGTFSQDDTYCKKIQKQIKSLKLEDRVVFHGFLDMKELELLYKISSVFILVSLSEGYGMVLAEAMSFGLPIIASTAGAIPELVTDDINGILVKPADSENLASAIRKLFERKDLRIKFGRNNLDEVKKLFTWKDFDRKLEQEIVPIIKQITGLGTQTDNNSVDLNK